MLRRSGLQGQGDACGRRQVEGDAILRSQAFSVGGSRCMLLPWRCNKRTVAYLNISGHSRQHLFRTMM